MKILHGARPNRISHRDYDFFKSHKYAGVATTVFKDEYFADAGLTMPNQEVPDTEYVPPTPSMPFGCTDFTQADLATDLTRIIHNPNDLEAVTHANAKGGYDVRASLDSGRSLGWFKQFFNIRTAGRLDYFDAFRVAQVLGINVWENRSITWGTPWFPSWEQAALHGTAIMPMPTFEELDAIRKNADAFSWHNSKLDGWTTRDGIPVYRNKSWQGNMVGDRGFIYFPREVINMVMTIPGTVAFTATAQGVDNPLRIDVTGLQWIVSVLRNLISKYV